MSSALVFGSADFLGGLASKRISSLRVTAIAAAVGLALLLAADLLIGGAWSASALLFGGLSGVSGALAISLLHACLAIGPMSILSPVTAVVSAIVPATIGILVRHDHFGTLGYVAIGLALVAVVFLGFVRDERAVRPTVRGLSMAVRSGVLIGLFLVLIDLTPKNSGLVPLLAKKCGEYDDNVRHDRCDRDRCPTPWRGRRAGRLASGHRPRDRLRNRGCRRQQRAPTRHPTG